MSEHNLDSMRVGLKSMQEVMDYIEAREALRPVLSVNVKSMGKEYVVLMTQEDEQTD